MELQGKIREVVFVTKFWFEKKLLILILFLILVIGISDCWSSILNDLK